MKPIEYGKIHYLARGLNFEQYLGYYLTNAYVYSSPDKFMMFKPIVAAIGEASWHPANPDAWYIHYAYGFNSFKCFKDKLPYFLPKICFFRHKSDQPDILKVYDSKRLYGKLKLNEI